MKFRPFLLLTTLVLVLVGLVAAAAQDAAFPVTIEHKFGSTTITEAPQRVVSIGFSEQDPLLALGIMPVAVRYWYGDENDPIFPWADEAAQNGEAPVVLNMEFGNLNYEAILSLAPDLIVALYSGITEEEYQTLSEIAPTIAQSADFVDFGMPWQEQTLTIGAAVGKSEEAAALVSEVEAQVAAAAEAHPEFVGKSIAVAYSFPEGYGYYTAQDPRGRFFTDLGFVVPDELIEVAGESYYANLSAERLDLLDQDLLVFVGLQFAEGGREAIESDPLIRQLSAVKEGRIFYVPADVDDALQFSTVLSLPYAVEGIVPELEAIFPGEGAASEAAS